MLPVKGVHVLRLMPEFKMSSSDAAKVFEVAQCQKFKSVLNVPFQPCDSINSRHTKVLLVIGVHVLRLTPESLKCLLLMLIQPKFPKSPSVKVEQ